MPTRHQLISEQVSKLLQEMAQDPEGLIRDRGEATRLAVDDFIQNIEEQWVQGPGQHPMRPNPPPMYGAHYGYHAAAHGYPSQYQERAYPPMSPGLLQPPPMSYHSYVPPRPMPQPIPFPPQFQMPQRSGWGSALTHGLVGAAALATGLHVGNRIGTVSGKEAGKQEAEKKAKEGSGKETMVSRMVNSLSNLFMKKEKPKPEDEAKPGDASTPSAK